jgi:hypothetical protein
MDSLKELANNWDLLTFGVAVVGSLVQWTKNYIRNTGRDVDPRVVAGLYAGIFSLVANLAHIGITGLSWEEVLANWWTLGSSVFGFAVLIYKLLHKKKESTEASL